MNSHQKESLRDKTTKNNKKHCGHMYFIYIFIAWIAYLATVIINSPTRIDLINKTV